MKNKKILLSGSVILLIVAGSLAVFFFNNHNTETKTTAPNNPNDNTVNLEPATKTDLENAENTKESIIERDKTNAASPTIDPITSKKIVNTAITYAGQYGSNVEVGAYADVFEEGGNCTATFVNGTKSFTVKVKANRNVRSVDCSVMSAQVSSFSVKGTWSVTVAYNSAAFTGTSEARTIEVK